MALKGFKVLELVGLAPGPFCGKILADFGATVTRIDKATNNHLDVLQHGKRTLALNLKQPTGQHLLRQLAKKYDVLIEPFRPGVMEKLNLGPDILCKENPRLIYARLTGFGQSGRLAQRAGHDINYAAISGVLSMFGRKGENPQAPVNVLADFAGGGLMCAFGICIALLELSRSGRGQVVDSAMIDGAAYVSSWLYMSRQLPIWGDERGGNVLDGGSYYYMVYKTKDNRYMSVGALEPQFFKVFAECMELTNLNQYDMSEATHKAIADKFLEKTQSEWSEIFENLDACVYPVLDWSNVMKHDHHVARDSFQTIDNVTVPKPAPRLSRTPGEVKATKAQNPTNDALDIIGDLDLNSDDLRKLVDNGTVLLPNMNAKL